MGNWGLTGSAGSATGAGGLAGAGGVIGGALVGAGGGGGAGVLQPLNHTARKSANKAEAAILDNFWM